MHLNLDEFLVLLEEENRVLLDLLALARDKRRLIILGHVNELDELMKSEGKLVMALEQIEARRFEMQNDLIQQLEMDSEDPTMDKLLQRVLQLGWPQAEPLQIEVEKLRETLNDLKFLNQENEDLINQSLSFIQALVEAMTRGGTTVYSHKGTMVETKGKLNLLDRKI